MTTGVLLQKIVSAKSLMEFTHVFIDEVSAPPFGRSLSPEQHRLPFLFVFENVGGCGGPGQRWPFRAYCIGSVAAGGISHLLLVNEVSWSIYCPFFWWGLSCLSLHLKRVQQLHCWPHWGACWLQPTRGGGLSA